jgi:hypothetical protein
MSDAERLAALIDGRLDERQRAELLARLAVSEKDLEVLADAGAVTRELEEEDRAAAAAGAEHGGADVIPLAPPRARRVPRYRWMPIAAVLAGIAVGGVYVASNPAAVAASPVAVVDHLENDDLPASAQLGPESWGTPDRGSGARLEPFARGVRLGVGLADLQVAVRSRDRVAVRVAAGEVSTLLKLVPAEASEASYYERVLQGKEAPSEADLKSRAGRVAKAADANAVALGAWARAARLAAAGGNAQFFTETHGELDRLAGANHLPKPVADALNKVKADLPRGRQPDWTRLPDDLERLLQAAGR